MLISSIDFFDRFFPRYSIRKHRQLDILKDFPQKLKYADKLPVYFWQKNQRIFSLKY